MMKKYCSIVMALVCMGYNVSAQFTGFQINGKVQASGYPVKGFVFTYQDSLGKRIYDTITIKENRFTISGFLYQPMRCRLIILPDKDKLPPQFHRPVSLAFALGNEQVYLDFHDPQDYVLSGSKVHSDEKHYRRLYLERLTENPGFSVTQQLQLTDSFILANPHSAFSMILLKERVRFARTADHLPLIFAQLPKSVRESLPGQEIYRMLQDLLAVKVGSMAPNFTLQALDRKLVDLAALRGQYVFLDFWASWCIPCRKENPNVVKAFHQLKSSNIVFIGISLDGENEKEAWQQAIEKDGLVWAQLSELKGFESPIVQLYKVTGVPRNFLIDPKGKIISINLKGENLAQLILNQMQKPGAE